MLDEIAIGYDIHKGHVAIVEVDRDIEIAESYCVGGDLGCISSKFI